MDLPVAPVDYGYAPDRLRARRLDERVRASLSASLTAIADALATNGAADPEPVRRLAGRVLLTPVRPLVFALYTELVYTIQSDDLDGLRRIVGLIAEAEGAVEAKFAIFNFGEPPLGAEVSRLYSGILDDDPEVPVSLHGLDPGEFAAGVAGVEGALALLGETAPDIAGEIAAFASEIVLARNSDAPVQPGLPPEPVFASGTSVYLWGAIFLDPVGVGRIGIAEMLVHEGAHCLLTALSNAEVLSANPKDARYSSPLRKDPRPMEGIIHAAYVLGRMIQGLERIATSPSLTAAERLDVATRRRDSVELFRQGVETIEAHAVLTPIGRRALEGCLAAGRRLPA